MPVFGPFKLLLRVLTKQTVAMCVIVTAKCEVFRLAA